MNGKLKRKLRRALLDMIKVSLKASPKEVAFGHPCSHLIEVVTNGGVDKFIERMYFEFRLNGAGLKLSIGDRGANVSGDQYNDYPVTAPKLNDILIRAGIHKRHQ